jgi:hypothetical protein
MEALLKQFTLFAAAIMLFALGNAAQAQRYTNYPVCAVYGGIGSRTVSCAFNNFAQCRMTVSGRGGFCEVNPDYVPPRKRTRRVY